MPRQGTDATPEVMPGAPENLQPEKDAPKEKAPKSRRKKDGPKVFTTNVLHSGVYYEQGQECKLTGKDLAHLEKHGLVDVED